MAEETITILRFETGEAVKSVNDLKENVKKLKESLGDLEIGSKEYQDRLNELNVNQKALKDAMHATSASYEDVAAGAKGLNVVFDEHNKLINEENQSYNALVNTMAELKEKWRATTDAAERANLGEQIDQINKRLKDLDAGVGSFQRNVGNYANSFKDAFSDMAKNMSEKTDTFSKGMGVMEGSLGGVKDGFEALSKSPAIFTFSILVSAGVKLWEVLKENETATASFKKGLDAVKPVTDFLGGVVEKLAEWLGVLITKVSTFITSNGLFEKIIDGVVGVGNAISKFVLSPFKGIAAAIKVFQEQGVKGLGNATKAFANEMKNGVSFKSNYKAGQALADGLVSGVKSKKDDIAKETAGVADTIADAIGEKFKLVDWKKKLDLGNKIKETIRQSNSEIGEALDELEKTEYDDITKYYEDLSVAEAESLNKSKTTTKLRLEDMQNLASGTSSLLSSIADMYEADSENSEKNANKIKALRIASATIDTISGAIGAYMSACETIPAPYGQIVGAVQAASITAAGLAQIAQIRNTDVSTSSTGTTTASSASATTTAPSVTADVQNVRNVTTASDEERLNQLTSSQKVYILQSDIEAANNASKVQVAEASF